MIISTLRHIVSFNFVKGTKIKMLSLLSILVFLFFVSDAKAQYVALKNNLLYDAALTPNLNLEFRLQKRWTLEAGVGFNPFPLSDAKDHKWRHLLVFVEPKYWFCEAFSRDFIGLNVAYSHFNVSGGAYPIGWLYPSVKNNRFEGDMVAAGVSYGWHFIVSPHVSFELEGGVDAGYAWFDRYACGKCGSLLDSPRKWFVAPKLAVNLVIMLR